jgi:hypothetical protein
MTETSTTSTEMPVSATVTAEPKRITVGGTVQLTANIHATTENAPDTYDVEWYVVGPVRMSRHETPISLLGTTTVTGNQVVLKTDERSSRFPYATQYATLDTSPLAVGVWRVGIRLTKPESGQAANKVERAVVDLDDDEALEDPEQAPTPFYSSESEAFEVVPRPLGAGDDVAVTLRRSAVPPTSDQALWARIRNSTNAIGFNRYNAFLEVVMCGEPPGPASRFDVNQARHKLRKVERRTALPFPNVDRYRLLKAATEVFLMVHCGVDLEDFSDVDLEEESRRVNRPVQRVDLETQMHSYLRRVWAGDDEFLHVLPYLALVRLQLRDVPIVGADRDEDEAAIVCQGIIAEKLTHPCFLELLWSYWLDEGNLVQTLNAVTWRFQNRTTAPPGRDPLAAMDTSPLRPLNNLLWGWIQDTQHRLTVARRAYEYDHEYGLVLASKPGPPVRGADSRSRFIEAYHTLLYVCAEFFIRDDDTTVIADGFNVLNALKETHNILTQGGGNAYGDLPWTARHEMLMNQWILARPEVREFLPARAMVVEPEPWMSRVDSMNKLQGWSDTAVLQFRDLATFGEQLLLSIRFGNWIVEDQPDNAANWARYWRPEIQRYTFAYRAVTGVDLIRQVDPAIPGFHMRRRHLAYRE